MNGSFRVQIELMMN